MKRASSTQQQASKAPPSQPSAEPPLSFPQRFTGGTTPTSGRSGDPIVIDTSDDGDDGDAHAGADIAHIADARHLFRAEAAVSRGSSTSSSSGGIIDVTQERVRSPVGSGPAAATVRGAEEEAQGIEEAWPVAAHDAPPTARDIATTIVGFGGGGGFADDSEDPDAAWAMEAMEDAMGEQEPTPARRAGAFTTEEEEHGADPDALIPDHVRGAAGVAPPPPPVADDATDLEFDPTADTDSDVDSNDSPINDDPYTGPTYRDLSKEQQRCVYEALVDRASMCITGGGGCGKSVIVRLIARKLKHKAAVVAPTGLAALNISGKTVHSFFGLGGTFTAANAGKCVSIASANSHVQRRLRGISTVIIDEVSMVSEAMFNGLDRIARKVRERPRQPFGGLQVILCGDFLQLPPVSGGFGDSSGPTFCFESTAWRDLRPHVRVLKQVFRQSDDRFITILNKIRKGVLPDEDREFLQRCGEATATPAGGESGIAAGPPPPPYTILRGANRSVDNHNEAAMAAIPGPSITYTAQDSNIGPTVKESTWPVAKHICIKIGARVMLRKNLSPMLVNGSCGVVVAFHNIGNPNSKLKPETRDLFERLGCRCAPEILFDGHTTPTIITPAEFLDGESGSGTPRRFQMPLCLAFALTIHKSQGMSIDRVDCEFATYGEQFAEGLLYVALSRAKTCAGLKAVIAKGMQPRANRKAIEWYAKVEALS